MKSTFIIISMLFTVQLMFGQQLDSIFFNLYTDSLKKGTYNYINVEGRFSDGSFLPLGDKELKFSATGGKFSRNSLFIDSTFNQDKVKVRVELIKNPRLWRETVIYIKKHEENERLPTVDEILNGQKGKGRKQRRNSR